MLNIIKKKSKFEDILERDINYYNHVLNSDKPLSPKGKVYWKIHRRPSFEPILTDIIVFSE
jgi:hypothetical protein